MTRNPRSPKPEKQPAKAVIRPSRRASASGDVAPRQTPGAIAAFEVRQATDGAQMAKAAAIEDIVSGSEVLEKLQPLLEGASADDREMLQRSLDQRRTGLFNEEQRKQDDELAADWRDGGYPYKNLM